MQRGEWAIAVKVIAYILWLPHTGCVAACTSPPPTFVDE